MVRTRSQRRVLTTPLSHPEIEEYIESTSGSSYLPGKSASIGEGNSSGMSLVFEGSSIYISPKKRKSSCPKGAVRKHDGSGEGDNKVKKRVKQKVKRSTNVEGCSKVEKRTEDITLVMDPEQSVKNSSKQVIRGRCILGEIVDVNVGLTDFQRDALRSTIWSPILSYKKFEMERDLTLELVKCWNHERKTFRLGGRDLPFSVYDVALFTGLPATGKPVIFSDDSNIVVGRLVSERIAEKEKLEFSERMIPKHGKRPRIWRNYTATLVELLHLNNTEEQLDLWLQIYSILVLSGLFFMRSAYGLAWQVLGYTVDVKAMSEYNWAEAVWTYMVESIEESRLKLEKGVADVQLNGFSLLLQVWFYEHTKRFACYDKKLFPRICSWTRVDHGGRYRGSVLLAGISEKEIVPVLEVREPERKEQVIIGFIDSPRFKHYLEDAEGLLSFDERLRRAREALVVEAEAHNATREELRMEKEANAALKMELDMLRGTLLPLEGKSVRMDDMPSTTDVDHPVVQNMGSPHVGVDQVYEKSHPSTFGMQFFEGCDSVVEEPQHHLEPHLEPVGFVLSLEGIVKGSNSNVGKRLRENPRQRKPAAVCSTPFTNPIIKKTYQGRVPRNPKPSGSHAHDDGGPLLKTMASMPTSENECTLLTEEDVRRYLCAPLSQNEVEIIKAVRLRCKSFKTKDEWSVELSEGGAKNLYADYVGGLIHQVPGRGPFSSKYCINGYALDLYGNMLSQREKQFPKLCRPSIFLKWHSQRMLSLYEEKNSALGNKFMSMLTTGLERVFIPVHDERGYHWFLFVVDLVEKKFCVYDSAPSAGRLRTRKDDRALLVDTAKLGLGIQLMQLSAYPDALTWELIHPECPNQENGVDCGVFVMILMDVLSLRATGLNFNQKDIPFLRERCLANLLQSRVTHMEEL